MPRYLIEIPHEDEHFACVRALRAIESFGSHFVARAEWGCRDGVHSGWLIADLLDRDDALLMVPPEFRAQARIVAVERFTGPEIAAMVAQGESSTADVPDRGA